MKILKAEVVVPGDDGYICYLTRKEAIVIKSLVGVCSGPPSTTPVRELTDEIFHRMSGMHIPSRAVTQDHGNIPLQAGIEI